MSAEPFRKASKRPGLAAPRVATDDHERAQVRAIDWALMRRLISLLAPWKRKYALGIGLGLIMVALEMTAPLFVKALINTATASDETIPRSNVTSRIIGLIVLWGSVWVAALLLQRATILIMTRAGEHVQFGLRRAVFAHLQKLSMSFYDKTKLGRIISRCTSDISSLREINVWGLDIILKSTLMIAAAATMLLATEPRLFLAIAPLGPVLYVCNRWYRRHAAQAHQVAREGYTRVAANLAENISGVRVVSAFHRQQRNLDVFNDLQEANTRNNVRAAKISGLYQSLLQFLGFVGRAIILVYGGYLLSQGRIVGGVGALIAAFLYWDWLMNPILTLGNFHNQVLTALAGAERVFNLLDTVPEVRDMPGARSMPRIQGRVQFEHVSFGYDPATPVLHDVDFEVPPGAVTALVGPTGSGKSTIVALLARFYAPQEGHIRVDGIDLAEVAAESLHHQMGLVSQSNFLFSGTVLDNIRYARPYAGEEEVTDAARRLGTLDAIRRLPEGLATQVGERGANISIGQRQLICFTRAFLADPRIFILDEATSAVDTATELTIQRSLEQLLAGRTTFIVAHRLSTIRRADQILVLDQGRIIERGKHKELCALGGKYARLHEQFVRA